MKKITLLLALLFAGGISGLFTSCEKNSDNIDPGDPVEIVLTLKQKELVSDANRFAFDIFKPLLSDSKGVGNIMISPFSITSALSMTLNGAAGETFDAMRYTLRYDNKTIEEINETYLKLMTDMVPVDKRVIMEIANSVWVDRKMTVKQPFIDALKKYYQAEARTIDMTDPGAATLVNKWIEEKTHDKIQKMLDALDPDQALLLINAIYFKGKWRHQFDKSDTRDKPFYITPSVSKQVPMMYAEENYAVTNTSNATLVELPYGQGNYTMVVMLPNEGISVSEAAASINPTEWEQWMSALSEGATEVKLNMPRFKYKYKITLNQNLADMGMGVAMSPSADFSRISDTGLMISMVLHQTFIETNEEGTEAAAATVVGMVTTSVPVVREIDLDRPFLYFIRESTTGTIVFMGVVSDPTLG